MAWDLTYLLFNSQLTLIELGPTAVNVFDF